MRLLSPRERPIEPAEIDLHSFFSDAEIERGARFARPQLALGLGRAATRARRARVGRPPAATMAVRAGPSGRRSRGARCRRRPGRRAVAAGAAAVGDRAPARHGGRARHPVLARVGGRSGQGRGDRVGARGRGRERGGGRHPALSASLVAARRGGLRRVRRACSRRSRRSCSTRCSTTSRRCPRARRVRTCSSSLARAGVKVGEVYSVDASRRTTAANAYVTGLGPTKRVVLFDTLLDRYSRDEIRVVVAHELGPRAQPRRAARRAVRGAGRAGRRARGPAAELGAVARARQRRRAARARAGGGGGWSTRRG